ncbi:helix-turn-helix domain-containing protein, partial [Rothia dentocariosa]
METTKNLYTPSLALARQVKAAATRVGLSQYKLAQILGVSPASMSKRLTGQKEFTFSDLLVIAGALDMSLSELLGDDIANTKMPAPSYVEDAGKRKVAPIGFVPNGATYQI